MWKGWHVLFYILVKEKYIHNWKIIYNLAYTEVLLTKPTVIALLFSDFSIFEPSSRMGILAFWLGDRSKDVTIASRGRGDNCSQLLGWTGLCGWWLDLSPPGTDDDLVLGSRLKACWLVAMIFGMLRLLETGIILTFCRWSTSGLHNLDSLSLSNGICIKVLYILAEENIW